MKTKEKIQNAALLLFAEKGYKAVGVGEIAAAVGIKPPSLYKHYKSKQDIFNSIIERMKERDAEQSESYTMPQSTLTEDSCGYENLSFRQISEYTLSMFEYWTKDSFACNFRKMLTVEQYKDKRSTELYHQYICRGPIEYMSGIFSFAPDISKDPYGLAVEFYSPMFLMYSLYDSGTDFDKLKICLENHIKEFFERNTDSDLS